MDTKARKFIAANISKLRKTRNIVGAKVCWFTVYKGLIFTKPFIIGAKS